MRGIFFYTSLVFMCVSSFSCNHTIEQKQEAIKSIIIKLYNNQCSKFLIPPPPEDIDADNIEPLLFEIPKEYLSEKKIHLKKFAISIYEESKLSTSEISGLSSGYKELFQNSSNEYSYQNLSRLNFTDSKGLEIPIITEKMKIQDIKKEYDVMGVIYISNFRINEALDKAILEFGSYTHGLAGFTAIYCLEKKNEKWEIVESIGLSES